MARQDQQRVGNAGQAMRPAYRVERVIGLQLAGMVNDHDGDAGMILCQLVQRLERARVLIISRSLAGGFRLDAALGVENDQPCPSMIGKPLAKVIN